MDCIAARLRADLAAATDASMFAFICASTVSTSALASSSSWIVPEAILNERSALSALPDAFVGDFVGELVVGSDVGEPVVGAGVFSGSCPVRL